MYENRFGSQFQEQAAYSSISQFLYNENERSHYSKIQNQYDADQICNNQAIDIDKQKLLDQSKMSDNQHQYSNQLSNSSNSSSENKQKSKTKINRKPKRSFKNKESKNKFYAKNYRQKKKEKLKSLQEENSFLKQKINDLTFRLEQTEIELNRFKHNNQSYKPSSFQSTRQQLLKQINENINKQNKQFEKLSELLNQVKKLGAFDSKHRIDLLNYFMSELLENLVSDMAFYFSDSLMSQKGLWKNDPTQPCRKIDYEVCQVIGLSNFEVVKKLLNSIPQFNLNHLKNFKQLWKKLYKDYLSIVNQGNFIESLCRPFYSKENKNNLHNRVLGSLKLQLYFEKIKYRQDMRELRQSWFQEIKFDKDEIKLIKHKNQKIENIQMIAQKKQKQ